MYGLTSFTIKNMTLRNRIVMPPMCMYSAGTDGMAKAFHFSHYTARAVGGVGLIIMEATGVLPCGRISDHCLGLWNDEQAEALAPIVRACQEQGAKMALQLNHAGRKCEASVPAVYAPSAIPFDEGAPLPREMTEADIRETVAAFRSAAARAARIGFDAIEIHAAHGYLLSEFLSPLTNRRADGYGGSTENRCRLLLEVLQAVHEVWPAEKPVLVRVSAEDYEPDGMHPEEMARVAALIRPYADILDATRVLVCWLSSQGGGISPAGVRPAGDHGWSDYRSASGGRNPGDRPRGPCSTWPRVVAQPLLGAQHGAGLPDRLRLARGVCAWLQGPPIRNAGKTPPKQRFGGVFPQSYIWGINRLRWRSICRSRMLSYSARCSRQKR